MDVYWIRERANIAFIRFCYSFRQGLKGSKHFIKDYLIPTEVIKNNVKITGAYIMDMILSFDGGNGSQDTNSFRVRLAFN